MDSSVLIISICSVIVFGNIAFSNAAPLIDDVVVFALQASNSSDVSEEANDSIDLSHFGNSLFGSPDDKITAAAVDKYTKDTNVNPEELGSYVEGDILIPKDFLRNGLIAQSYRWPNAVVPFEIRGQFTAHDWAILENAFHEYHTRTCVRFEPRTNQADYISIVSGRSGCWSSVGKIGGKQEVNLQSPGCFMQKGTAIHELMHVLGFLHEQNRYERDNFVRIEYANIHDHVYSNFAKASPAKTSALGVPYDYGSVMHYSAYAFSKNKRPTILPLRNTGERMGQRQGLSSMDVEKINRMYGCDTPMTSVVSQQSVASSFLQGLLSGFGK